ncbi:hypothetical protein, partial [Mesorhizobium waimense]|uniref:hypothetical protein n=1 Tax=Mesorhizobium waimense TaxID=1300307 RepID=UPI001ABFB021
AFAGLDRHNNTLTKIIRKRSRHPMLASDPASILNHKSAKTGIWRSYGVSGDGMAPSSFDRSDRGVP